MILSLRYRTLLMVGCLTIGSTASLFAQAPKEPAAKAADTTMTDAVKFRTEIAEAVGLGAVSADEGLKQLQTKGKLTGLEIESSADLAYGAIDLGQRLVASGKPDLAEKFFRAAEQELVALVKGTAEARATDKAQFLRKLAFVRSNFLGQTAQATLDLDQAIALQPKDVDLLLAKQSLAKTTANVDAMKPRN